MARLLVVDDEEGIRGMLEVVLRRDGHQVSLVASADEALARIDREGPPEMLITDLRMDGTDGLTLLSRLRSAHPDCFVLVMTAYADHGTAVQAMRLGAWNFLAKPFDMAALRTLVRRCADAREHHLAARQLGEREPAALHLVGTSAPIQEIQRLIEQVAATDATVLVTGESGTGKELVSRGVHYGSLRADGPLVRVNAGALTVSLLESELFGHVKGAFTGAVSDRPGLFSLADTGTLFLDEVGDLPAETQVKLLRVLETGEYLPVGSSQVRRCDVRVVAATNRNLRAMVQASSFREDLYYRLAVITIDIPPLRARPEDIPVLAGHLLSRHAVRLRRGIAGFTEDAMDAMLAYHWPGNVRELDNRIQRGVALTEAGDISVETLFGDVGTSRTEMWRAIRGEISGRHQRRPSDPDSAALERRRSTEQITASAPAPVETQDLCAHLSDGGQIDYDEELRRIEREILCAALAATDGVLTEAAKRLGLSFRQVRYKVRQLGLR